MCNKINLFFLAFGIFVAPDKLCVAEMFYPSTSTWSQDRQEFEYIKPSHDQTKRTPLKVQIGEDHVYVCPKVFYNPGEVSLACFWVPESFALEGRAICWHDYGIGLVRHVFDPSKPGEILVMNDGVDVREMLPDSGNKQCAGTLKNFIFDEYFKLTLLNSVFSPIEIKARPEKGRQGRNTTDGILKSVIVKIPGAEIDGVKNYTWHIKPSVRICDLDRCQRYQLSVQASEEKDSRRVVFATLDPMFLFWNFG